MHSACTSPKKSVYKSHEFDMLLWALKNRNTAHKVDDLPSLWSVMETTFFCLENEFHVVRLNSTKSRFTEKNLIASVSFNWVIMDNGYHNHQNGNHQEFPNVTVIESRCVKYLLTKLRNKETCSKVQWHKSSHSFYKFQLELDF